MDFKLKFKSAIRKHKITRAPQGLLSRCPPLHLHVGKRFDEEGIDLVRLVACSIAADPNLNLKTAIRKRKITRTPQGLLARPLCGCSAGLPEGCPSGFRAPTAAPSRV